MVSLPIDKTIRCGEGLFGVGVSLEDGSRSVKLFQQDDPGQFMGKGHGGQAYFSGVRKFHARQGSPGAPGTKIKILRTPGHPIGKFQGLHGFTRGIKGKKNPPSPMMVSPFLDFPGGFLDVHQGHGPKAIQAFMKLFCKGFQSWVFECADEETVNQG